MLTIFLKFQLLWFPPLIMVFIPKLSGLRFLQQVAHTAPIRHYSSMGTFFSSFFNSTVLLLVLPPVTHYSERALKIMCMVSYNKPQPSLQPPRHQKLHQLLFPILFHHWLQYFIKTFLLVVLSGRPIIYFQYASTHSRGVKMEASFVTAFPLISGFHR